MSLVKELLENLNKFTEERKFQENDFVFYTSASGRDYNCFGKVIGYISNYKLIVKILCKANGDSAIDDVADEDGKIFANEYALKPGKEMLEKRISYLEKNLETLKKLQEEI